MNIAAIRSFRRAFAGLLSFLFVLSFAQSLKAQDAPEATTIVQQANAALLTQSESGGAPTLNTRATLMMRHEKLIELFLTHPELARKYALGGETRRALLEAEPSYSALIEQDVPLTGQLTVSYADDFAHHTSTKHYSLHSFQGDRGLSFATVPPQLAKLEGHNVTVTGLSLPEIVAAETVQEAPRGAAAPEATAVLPTLESAVIATTAATQTITSIGSGVPTGSATLLDSTFGNQTTAVLILKFTGSTATYPKGTDQQAPYLQAFQGPATPNVNEFLKEVSYGQTSMTTDVYTPLTVTGNFTCNTTDAMATAVIPAAIAAGLDISKYNHFVFVYPVASCYFGGLGSGAPNNATALIPHQYTYIWLPVTPSTDYTSQSSADFLWFANAQHEFGHNLGLGHSNSLDFGALSLGPLDFVSVNPGTVTPGDSAPSSPSAGPSGLISPINTEYGDDFADMGNFQGRYNGNHVSQILGWIPPASVRDVTTSGSYTIAPSEVNTGIRTLHVLRDAASSSWVWVEYHQPVGIYTPKSESANPLNTTPNNLYSGAMLHYQDGFNNDGHTFLMDMTPAAQPNKFNDAILATGKSWSDPYSLLRITTGTQNATSLGINVSYDAPCAAVTLDSVTAPAAGGTGSVTITAPSSCSWSVSSNASWISFSGTTNGTGNGSVQFVSAANTAAGQRNSYITAQRQSLPIVQLGTGVSILPRTGVSVAAGVPVPLVFNIVDNAGFADLSELDFVIKGGTQPDCTIMTTASSSDGVKSNNDVFFALSLNGITSDYADTGVAGTLSNAACTIDAGTSSYSAKGKNITLTLMVSFPASSMGVHPITGVGYGAGNGITVPLSYVNVTTAMAAANVIISPASSVAPLSGSADSTVPFTITGTNTNFTAGSAVSVGGAGIAAKNVTVVNAHIITGNFVVKSTAKMGSQPVTITSGSEVETTTFTVTSATPVVVLSPAAGALGTKVPVTIIGSNTHFTAASTITVSGSRFGINKVTFVSATELTAEFVLEADGGAGPRIITVTTGDKVDTATFTVDPAPIPEALIAPATGNQGDFRVVTVRGTNTNFTVATKITIPGTDIKVTEVSVEDASTITAKFTMTATASAGARMITFTTGTEVVKGTFTVTAMADTTTTIAAVAASVEETAPALLTVTVTPKAGTGVPTGYVSVTETGRANGLEDIVGTIQLSGGKARIPLSNLTVGKHSFSAQYLGDNASFAQSVSTADVKVTVTADPGKPTLAESATIQMLSDGRYEAIVTIANSGKGTAKKVVMTKATLGGAMSTSTLPSTAPDIAPGLSTTMLIDFPASAGTPGSASVMKFGGTFTGGTFTVSTRVTLPAAPATN